MAAALAALALGGLTACAEAGVSEDDAYAIGCPAIDSAIGSGSVAGRATVAGLERIRDAIDPATGTREWIDAAITLLQSADADDLPPAARKLLVDGCAEHGHQLRNLRA
ncbi:MAG: hypothetical protein ACLGIF_08360 [Actinomycetes bacterium]